MLLYHIARLVWYCHMISCGMLDALTIDVLTGSARTALGRPDLPLRLLRMRTERQLYNVRLDS